LIVVKLAFFAVSAFFFGAVVMVALGAFLILTGSPSTCATPGFAAFPSPELAQQLNQRWATFSGESQIEPASIQITDAEATARGRQYLEDENVPIHDFRVVFCADGRGQIAGKVEALGIDADFVATGHLDVSGLQPVVELDSVDVGNLPGFVSDAVLNALLDDDARTLKLDENLVGSEISDGLIVISGGPS
jgi:hypothetical protein